MLNRGSLLAMAALAIFACGCGGHTSADQALNKALLREGLERQRVFPLAGVVTVDGLPPQFDPQQPVVVILIDTRAPPRQLAVPYFVPCDREGHFQFSTYKRGDGVKPGHYVVAIAKLRRMLGRFVGPDQFQNLFNDPEKNAKDPRFQLDHRQPGKTDYTFDLTVAGIQPPENTPPKAIISLPK
jgi:hypothetical protein